MDETPPVLLPATTIDTTGKKTITMKSTGHKKSHVFVCLASKDDGTKLKPMIVLKGAVKECKVLCQEFRTQAVSGSKMFGAFSFKQRLLA